MDNVIKSFLGIFMTMLSLFVSVSIIGAAISASNAASLHADIIRQVEDSNFNAGVIKDCEENIPDGWVCNIEEYSKNDRVYMARVDLKYTVAIPFLGNSWTQTRRGFAR